MTYKILSSYSSVTQSFLFFLLVKQVIALAVGTEMHFRMWIYSIYRVYIYIYRSIIVTFFNIAELSMCVWSSMLLYAFVGYIRGILRVHDFRGTAPPDSVSHRDDPPPP